MLGVAPFLLLGVVLLGVVVVEVILVGVVLVGVVRSRSGHSLTIVQKFEDK